MQEAVKQKEENKIYFSGINALRFFAAFGVIITHIELLKGNFGFRNLWTNPIVFNLGGLGVYFFFVLSGFLITFLLLTEKEKYRGIQVKKFYLRRILRIWPLYYFIVVIGFFVLPFFPQINIKYLQFDFEKHFTSHLILYLFILPNVSFSLYPAVPHIGQAWSIGIEEQFYILWPLIIDRTKNVLKTLFIIIFAIVFVKIIVLLLGYFYQNQHWYSALKRLAAMSKFECMAIGGLGAYFLFNHNQKILNIIYSKFVYAISLISILVLIYITPEKLQDGIHLVYAVLFVVVILNVTKKSSLLENRLLSYLGKISYGIYMYHFMIIPIVLVCCKNYLLNINEWMLNVIIYSTVTIITIIISGTSYHFFEKKFIRLKKKQEVIKSGGD